VYTAWVNMESSLHHVYIIVFAGGATWFVETTDLTCQLRMDAEFMIGRYCQTICIEPLLE
jgi:hypothetical protein